MQQETSVKTLQKSILSRGKNIWYLQVVLAKLITLQDTLLASNKDHAMLFPNVD